MGSAPFRLNRKVVNLDSPLSVVILVCVVAALSYLAATVGGALMIRPQMIWPLWPGCAFLVAVLLLTPRKIWPALLIAGLAGFLLFDVRAGLTVRATLWLILGDTVEILIAALGVSYFFGGVPHLTSIKSLAKYSLFALILAPISVAFVGAIALGGGYWQTWRTSLLTEALALLTLTPAILSWVETAITRTQKSRAYHLEAAALMSALVVLGYVTFVAAGGNRRPELLYSLVPLLLWSALRFGIQGATTSMLAVAFLSIWGTVHGRGPFTGSGSSNNVFSLQLFLLFAAASFMVLGALVEERKATVQALRNSEVRERTKAKELETVLDAVPMPVLIASDAKCERITANRAGCELLRLSADANVSKNAPPHQQPKFRIMLDGVEVPAEQLPMQRAAATGTAVTGVSELVVFEDGTERNFIVNAAPLLGENGTTYGAVAAVLDVTERKQAEKAVRDSEAYLAEGQRLTHTGSGAWRVPGGEALYLSDEWYRIYDFDPKQGLSAWKDRISRMHPKDRAKVEETKDRAILEKSAYEVEHRIILPDGTVKYTHTVGRPVLNASGDVEQFVFTMMDITERKQAEKAVRESEERFRLVANTAPVLIWMSGPDKLCNYFNQPWLDFSGRTLDQEFGNGWSEGVHPDDLHTCLITYDHAFDRREEFKMEYRLRRFDGEYRWVLDIGVPRFSADGSFSGYIGSCIDITERKLAEEVLASVSRRLIQTQEVERKRIGRDLHDDIGQRLALLAVGLQQIKQVSPDSALELTSRMEELRKYTLEIATDIQALSHELHSSRLEYLGVVSAMKGFCKEFGEQQRLEIDFRSHDLPDPLPSPEISLSLFRVLQEALHNASKYSGVRHFEVQLWGGPGEIHLAVTDSGAGFDIQATKEGRGLGLTSMEERLKLVNGQLLIESQPNRGTTIHARVPLSLNGNSDRKVG
jgi:PAS domain S-box-containing protein